MRLSGRSRFVDKILAKCRNSKAHTARRNWDVSIDRHPKCRCWQIFLHHSNSALKYVGRGLLHFYQLINSYRTEYISVSDNSQLNQEKLKYPKPKPRILGH